jgi:hypothetical protein
LYLLYKIILIYTLVTLNFFVEGSRLLSAYRHAIAGSPVGGGLNLLIYLFDNKSSFYSYFKNKNKNYSRGKIYTFLLVAISNKVFSLNPITGIIIKNHEK